MNSHPYTSVILNDLHQHFPDLLYQSERFQSVQDVLQYMIRVAQDNPFERNRRLFLSSSSSLQGPPPLSTQEEKEYEEPVQDHEEKEQKEENDSKEPYQFNVSSSAYVVTSPSEPEPVGVPTFVPASQGQGRIEQESDTHEILRLMMNRRQREASSDPTSVLLRLLNGRPSQHTSNRFRISVPLSSSSLLSSQYSSPVPSLLQGLSQLQSLHSLQDLLQPVAVRPTEQHLAQNTYVYRSEVSLNDNCAICQDPMEAGQETRTILACSHCFHRECVDRWFQDHVQCPTCRHDVREGN